MFRLAGLLILAGVMSGQTLLTVRVWDYAGIPAPVLASAEIEMSYLFGQAGLQVEWLACNPANRQGPGCDVPSASNIILRILRRSASTGAAGADVLGRAIGDRFADVYDAQVNDAALNQNSPRNQVYAMAIMHELGHLLLGPGSHTRTGLMRPKWGSAEFAAASKRQLRFTARQYQVIRASVESRTHVAE